MNTLDHDDVALWHSNYGAGGNGAHKPELVAPILPGTDTESEACGLFSRRAARRRRGRLHPGSWNDWRAPGFGARPLEPGIWETEAGGLAPGRYLYKILIDGNRWLDDPANPRKAPDGCGGLNSVLTIPQHHRVEWRLA